MYRGEVQIDHIIYCTCVQWTYSTYKEPCHKELLLIKNKLILVDSMVLVSGVNRMAVVHALFEHIMLTGVVKSVRNDVRVLKYQLM